MTLRASLCSPLLPLPRYLDTAHALHDLSACGVGGGWQRSHAVHHARCNHLLDGETHNPGLKRKLLSALSATVDAIGEDALVDGGADRQAPAVRLGNVPANARHGQQAPPSD
jgi:hypothetical protein